MLITFVRAAVRDDSLADDIFQETMLVAFPELGRIASTAGCDILGAESARLASVRRLFLSRIGLTIGAAV